MCHIQSSQQVDSKSIVKANFKTGMDQVTFGGVLLYHLSRKEDTSISTQLLVIWGYKSNKLYSHVRLIEHESTLDWDKEKLRMLYDEYDSQYNIDFIMEGRLLSDNTKLKTKCETSRGGLEMSVVIYEEKDLL
jgi:hypothetical protein